MLKTIIKERDITGKLTKYFIAIRNFHSSVKKVAKGLKK